MDVSYAWISQLWGVKVSTTRWWNEEANLGNKYPLATLQVDWDVVVKGSTVSVVNVFGSVNTIASQAMPSSSFNKQTRDGNAGSDALLTFQWSFSGNVNSGSASTSVSGGVSAGGKEGGGTVSATAGSSKSFEINTGGATLKKYRFDQTGDWFSHGASQKMKDVVVRCSVSGGNEEEFFLYRDLEGFTTTDDVVKKAINGKKQPGAQATIERAHAVASGPRASRYNYQNRLVAGVNDVWEEATFGVSEQEYRDALIDFLNKHGAV